MTLRPATLNDLPDMVTLLEELFALEPDFVFQPEVHSQGLALLLAEPRARALLATRAYDGKVVGMITLQPHISTGFGQIDGIIEDLVVSQRYRGQGIGGLLLLQMETWAREQGYARLRLAADHENTTAWNFYRKHGWNSGRMVSFYRDLASLVPTDLSFSAT